MCAPNLANTSLAATVKTRLKIAIRR